MINEKDAVYESLTYSAELYVSAGLIWKSSRDIQEQTIFVGNIPLMNSLTREKGDTKEFRRLVLCSFGKGRRETQKEFRRLVLGEFFLAKGEENEKMNNTSFQGLENQKTSESFWYKE